MDAITVREEGTDSPNVGTVNCNGMSLMYSVDNLSRCLLEHFDCEVIFFLKSEDVERIQSKGSTELDIVVQSTTPYKSVVTLEATWIY